MKNLTTKPKQQLRLMMKRLFFMLTFLSTSYTLMGQFPTIVEGWAVGTYIRNSGEGRLVFFGVSDTTGVERGLNWAPESHLLTTQLGSIFGIALDNAPNQNIYVTASTSYGNIKLGSVYIHQSNTDEDEPFGAVYKIDGTTGVVTLFAELPNPGGIPDAAGLGNIAFDPDHNQLYVSNFYDGKIYTLDATSGVILGTFDHRHPFNESNNPDNSTSPHFVTVGERVWGIQYNHIKKRLYYAVWSSHRNNGNLNNATKTRDSDGVINEYEEVYSITIDDYGDFVGKERLEVGLEDSVIPWPEGTTLVHNLPSSFEFSHPISDISFSPDGTKMLLAERNMEAFAELDEVYGSRILEYVFDIGMDQWVPSLDGFFVGGSSVNPGHSAAGGVDYTASGDVWATSDDFLTKSPSFPERIGGIGLLPGTGNTIGSDSTLFLVDFDEIVGNDANGHIGDVEIFKDSPAPCTRIDDISISTNCERDRENDNDLIKTDVHLELSNPNDVDSFFLDFGNGFFVTSLEELTTYEDRAYCSTPPGDYTATMIVYYHTGCNRRIARKINVQVVGVCGEDNTAFEPFTVTPTPTGCGISDIALAIDGSVSNFYLDYGNGSTITNPADFDPSEAYASSFGTFNIHMDVTTSGCRKIVDQEVVITDCLRQGWTAATGSPVKTSGFSNKVLTFFDVSDPEGSVVPGDNWEPTTFEHDDWTVGKLGSIYGIAINNDPVQPVVFVTASSCYDDGHPGNIYDNGSTQGGNAPLGAIYKVDAMTGTPSLFAELPNLNSRFDFGKRVSGGGLGNISFDGEHQQLYVTNIYNGKIYTLNANTGEILDSLDHGDPFDPAKNVNTSNSAGNGNRYAPLGERLWGIQYNHQKKRVYYAVWTTDFGTYQLGIDAPQHEIHSIAINESGSFEGLSRLEITLPYLEGETYSNPVADISFSPDGTKMLLSERGMNGPSESTPYVSRVLEYFFDTKTGEWKTSDATFFIGGDGDSFNSYPLTITIIDPLIITPGTSSGGGIDYTRSGDVWATGDVITNRYNNEQHGMALISENGNTIDADHTSYIVPLPVVNVRPTSAGDVEVFRSSEDCLDHSPSISFSPINCGASISFPTLQLDLDEGSDSVTNFSLIFINDTAGDVLTFNNLNALVDLTPFELGLTFAAYAVNSFVMEVEYESGCVETIAQVIFPECCPDPSISFTPGNCGDVNSFPTLELDLDEGRHSVTRFSLVFINDSAEDVLTFNDPNVLLAFLPSELGLIFAAYKVDSFVMEVRYASGCMYTVAQVVFPECDGTSGKEDAILTSVDELSDQTEGIHIYPNPAKDVVNVGIKLQEAATTEIVVTDLLGNSIKTLLNTTLVAGNHQVTWEVRDVPNGVYLINFKTNNLSTIKKVIVNR